MERSPSTSSMEVASTAYVDSLPRLIPRARVRGPVHLRQPSCKEILGYDVEDTQSMKFGDRTHPEDYARRPVALPGHHRRQADFCLS